MSSTPEPAPRRRRGPKPAPRRARWAWLVAPALAALGASYALAPTGPGPERVLDFQQYRFGLTPGDFDFDATGAHGPVLTAGQPLWRTYVDLFAPSPKLVLLQASTLDRPDHYPIALLRDFSATDLMLFSYLKPMGGEGSQRAGLIWRARGKDDYYAALVDARADRLDVLKMEHGRPQPIGTAPVAVDVEFERRGSPSATHGWYTLRVEAVGDRMSVFFQGEKVIEARDATLPGPGRVGLISHADTVALWDDIHVQAGRRFVVPTPRPPAPPEPPPVVHVTEVVTTDASFRRPANTFSEEAYWRVAVADAHQQPAAGVVVASEVAGPTGAPLATRTVMTGTDGTALFALPFSRGDDDGTYTVRVVGLTHADRADVAYDASANRASSVTFQATPSRARRVKAPAHSGGDTARRRPIP